MTTTVSRLLIFFCVALLSLVAPNYLRAQSNQDSATMITPAEAAVLVYVSPAGAPARATRSDVGVELQSDAKLNQTDYYYYWVYDARHTSHGSVTIGYYAVNKHTGEVWDTDQKKELSATLLSGVQRLLRRAHGISDGTIAAYHGRTY